MLLQFLDETKEESKVGFFGETIESEAAIQANEGKDISTTKDLERAVVETDQDRSKFAKIL
jgi:hypothetical protein